jgi:hypothetical protein
MEATSHGGMSCRMTSRKPQESESSKRCSLDRHTGYEQYSFMAVSGRHRRFRVSNCAQALPSVHVCWNVGTVDKCIVEFAKESKRPFPADISTIIGKKYKVAVCFIST